MGWSCIIFFLVATATGKGLTVEGLRSGHIHRWQWHPLCFSLHRCPLPGPAAAVWTWAGEAWGFSEDILQGFWLLIHWLLHALGEAEPLKEPWVDWTYYSLQWWYWLQPEVQGQGHIDCRQILQHSLHAAQQPDIWGLCGLLLCKTQCCNHILSVSETLEEQQAL